MNILAKAAIGATTAVTTAIIGAALFTDWSTIAGSSAGTTPHLASAVSSPVDLSIVHGWPGTRHNRAGRYSWNMQVKSWMHNPSDNNIGVSITFSALSNTYENGPTVVTVGGYDGTYQELPMSADGVRTELWIVDIEDTRVTFTVEAQPGTTEAELAEAHEIIGSIRSEPRRKKNGGGFRLTFTLPGGWDSG